MPCLSKNGSLSIRFFPNLSPTLSCHKKMQSYTKIVKTCSTLFPAFSSASSRTSPSRPEKNISLHKKVSFLSIPQTFKTLSINNPIPQKIYNTRVPRTIKKCQSIYYTTQKPINAGFLHAYTNILMCASKHLYNSIQGIFLH